MSGGGHRRVRIASHEEGPAERVPGFRDLVAPSGPHGTRRFVSRAPETPQGWEPGFLSDAPEDSAVRAMVSAAMALPSAELAYLGLADAYLIPASGLVLVEGGTAILDLSAMGATSEDLTRLEEIARLPGFALSPDRELLFDEGRLAAAPRLAEPVLFPFHAGHATYGHWFFDCVPPVFDARADLRGLGLRIAAPALAPWQVDSLRYLGCEDLLLPVTAPVVRCDRLVLPSFVGIRNTRACGPVTAEAMEAVRRGCLGPEAPSPSRAVYLSRRKVSARRRMVNEDEVERYLAAQDVDVVFPEELSLAEQIRVFAGANLIISAVGSGNVNIGFSAPGTTLAEISIDGYVDPVFARLALVAGCTYLPYHETGLFRDRALERDVGVGGAHQSFAYAIDLPRLAATLRRHRGSGFPPPPEPSGFPAHAALLDEPARRGRALVGLGPDRYAVRTLVAARPPRLGAAVWDGALADLPGQIYEPLLDPPLPVVLVEGRQPPMSLALQVAELGGFLERGTVLVLAPLDLGMAPGDAADFRLASLAFARLVAGLRSPDLLVASETDGADAVVSLALRPGAGFDPLALPRAAAACRPDDVGGVPPVAIPASVSGRPPDLPRTGLGDGGDRAAGSAAHLFGPAASLHPIVGAGEADVPPEDAGLISIDPAGQNISVHPRTPRQGPLASDCGTTRLSIRTIDAEGAVAVVATASHGHPDGAPVQFGIRLRCSRSGRLLGERARTVAPGQREPLAVHFTPPGGEPRIDVEFMTAMAPGIRSSSFAWACFVGPVLVREARA